jgi:Domain of unknown function (DUF6438)
LPTSLSFVSCSSSAASIPTQPFSVVEGFRQLRALSADLGQTQAPRLTARDCSSELFGFSLFTSPKTWRRFRIRAWGTSGWASASIRVMDRTLKQLCISAAAFTLCLYILFTPLFYFLRREWIDPYGIQRRRESEREIERKVESITEIYLARSGDCGGPCPIYSVTLRKDGTASYVGYENVIRPGRHHGKIDSYYFFRLAWLLDSQGFFQMKNEYPEDGTVIADASEANVGATRDGRKKDVWEYTGEGPIELWGIEMAIDAVVNEIQWEPNK